MTNPLFFRVILLLCCLPLIPSCAASFPQLFPYALKPKDSFFPSPEGIRILCSKGLKLLDTHGKPVEELSDLAWDADENILYAISDEGWLYHLKFEEKNGVIENVSVIAEYRLRDKKGRYLKKKWRDSEGLTSKYQNNKISGDTELLVAFEGKPRIARYTPQGKYLGEIKLPEKLWHKKTYRGKNKALESVAIHPDYGVVTAAEYPVRKNPMSQQTLYSAKGKEWDFSASHAKNSAVTGLEVMPNGDLLVLERAWAGVQNPVVIALSELSLADGVKHTKRKKLAIMSSTEGWLLDNFEGLTHYSNNQYLMVSDDGGNSFQTTVLVLFEVH